MLLLNTSLVFIALSACEAWGSGGEDRVLLNDVNVITLHSGRMTKGRRSAPVPQLSCQGGSAGSSFVPQVVQCYNRGSDGYDVQWECKTDMDNAYRFGRVEVTCEGYDSPDDPYILKGSCGLEYTLEYTKEGLEKNQGNQHQYYGDRQQQYPAHGIQKSGGVGNLVFLVGVGVVIYVIYRTCLTGSGDDTRQDARAGTPRGSDAPPPYPGTSQPPPAGFRSEYMPNGNTHSSSQYAPGYDSTGCGTTPPTHGSTGLGGGGFWSGAGIGGMMGYLFGSRNNRQGYYQQPSTGWGSGWGSQGSGWGSNRGSGWGSTHGSWGSSSPPRSSGFSSGSTGTRTASGFGGTKRR